MTCVRSKSHDALRLLLAIAAVLSVAWVGCRKDSPRQTETRRTTQESRAGNVVNKQVSSVRQRIPDDLVEVADVQYAPLNGLAPGSQETQERQRQTVQQLGLPLEVKTRKTGIVFRLIPAGRFMMGSTKAEQRAMSDFGERAVLWVMGGEVQHEVTLTKAFYCSQFEVTQAQWETVCGSNPSGFKNVGKDAPVEQVSWKDCQTFIKTLCQLEGVPDGTYRLLTEAEWEYACRAGTQTAFCYGNDLYLSMANFNKGWHDWAGKGVGRHSTMRVGSFRSNGWGLYDMHGNVDEWCQDWLYSRYPSRSVTDPLERRWSGERVRRGGSWTFGAHQCRSAYRCGNATWDRLNFVGLRLARTILSPSYE